MERSAFLEERLGGDFLPETCTEDSEVIDKRMSAWRKNCARGDEKVFARRLQWDGLDVDRARGVVARVRRVNPELPLWAPLLRQMIESSQEPWDEALRKKDLASIRAEQPVAFEEVFYSFLRLARETLRKESGAAYSLLAEAAHRQWERSLLLSWEKIAAETLDLEFTRFRTAHQASPAAIPSESESLPGTGCRQLYESFLRSLEGVGLLRLFLEYPVLARYLATKLSLWVDAARELLLRLEADQAWMPGQGFSAVLNILRGKGWCRTPARA